MKLREKLKDAFKNQTYQRFDYDYTGILIFLGLIALAVLIIVIIYFIRKKFNFLESKNFHHLAKSAGLDLTEIKMLYNLIIQFRIKYPLTCFTNAKLLDDILKKGIRNLHNNGKLTVEDKNDKISRLLNIKTSIDLNTKKNIGIKSTHFILDGQKLIVFIRGKGYFYASVIKNTRDHLIIEFMSNMIVKRLLALNEFIKIYFWRNEDAGYIFESAVIEYGHNVRTYLIKHSDKLVRSQKRKYKRIPVNFTGIIHPIRAENKTHIIDNTKSIKCSIMDLSAGGLKFNAGNFDDNIKLVKIIFDINDNSVSIAGKVVRSQTKTGHLKEVTVQFLKVSTDSGNIISSYIYNYLPAHF